MVVHSVIDRQVTILFCLAVYCFISAWMLVAIISRNGIVEGFTSLPQNVKDYGIETSLEAREIVEGNWSETIGHGKEFGSMKLYYSVFSQSSRNQLSTIPYSWKNICSNYDTTDSDIVFTSNPLQAYNDNLDRIYSEGLPLNVNNVPIRANGPKGMNLGINAEGVQPQSFTIVSLVRFGDNPGLPTSHETTPLQFSILKSWANNRVNTGLNIGIRAASDGGTSVYNVSIYVDVFDKTIITDIVSVDKSLYYVISVVMEKAVKGYTVSLFMHHIDKMGNVESVKLVNNIVITGDAIDFTNKPIEFGELVTPAKHPIAMLTFAIYTDSLSTHVLQAIAQYYANTIKKTSFTALQTYRTIMELSKCPLPEKQDCKTCAEVDWKNPLSVIAAPEECKKIIHNACVAKPDLEVCSGCYSPEKLSNPSCTALRNMYDGHRMYDLYELDKIKCTAEASEPIQPLQQSIINFYKQEATIISNTSIWKPPTFWQWMFKLK